MADVNHEIKDPEEFDQKDIKAAKPKARSKLGAVGHYILLALTPLISLAALGIAVYAYMGSHSGEGQLSKTNAKIETLNASMLADKADLEKLKITLAHDKGVQDEERKKLEDRLEKVIQNITPMQVKLKISPTLEAQLRQDSSASSVLPAGNSSTAAISAAHAAPSVPPAVSSMHAKPEAPIVSKTHSGSSSATSVSKKQGSQSQVLKEAIDKFNKK